jgi:glycosyltransferase involved in cell wall biosynthesis
MPSYFESLSMVALEAWALGRPVLANAHCDVLKGQCIRSNAGLYYESYEEFVEALYSLESNGPLNARLGRNGREFFKRNYAWPVIERKYLDMFDG